MVDFNDKRKLDTSRVSRVKDDSRGVQLMKAARDRLSKNDSDKTPKTHIAGPADHVSEARRDKAHARNKRKFG